MAAMIVGEHIEFDATQTEPVIGKIKHFCDQRTADPAAVPCLVHADGDRRRMGTAQLARRDNIPKPTSISPTTAAMATLEASNFSIHARVFSRVGYGALGLPCNIAGCNSSAWSCSASATRSARSVKLSDSDVVVMFLPIHLQCQFERARE